MSEVRSRARQCTRKVRYENQDEALVGLQKLHGASPELNVYECPHCNHWHIGHTIKEKAEMSGPSIRVTRDFYAIRVFINDLLHVHVKTSELIAVHSWVKPAHCIEYVLRGGTMLTEYDAREKWELVLCGLEGVL